MLYDIHPASVKHLIKGHPWVTADQFTKKFNPKQSFIIAKNRGKPFALLLHDPKHPQVKARLWSLKRNFQKQIEEFSKDLKTRLKVAIEKRSKIDQSRENIYLVFGEVDEIPGLHILKLKDRILIQSYAFFWEPRLNEIVGFLKSLIDFELEDRKIWIQTRAGKQSAPKCWDDSVKEDIFTLNEFGCDYELRFGKSYDYGLYTDMANIRFSLKGYIGGAKKFLNLYSYTGAFSVFALKNGVPEVHSVDLSRDYLDWLEHNIKINDLPGKHKSLCGPSAKILKKLESASYDFILSDPPTSSSDGKKRQNALQGYDQELEQMERLLVKGGTLVVFLNTHSVTFNKFKQRILHLCQTRNLKLKLLKSLKMSADCPGKAGFPEGSYLKGLVFQKI